MAKAKKRIKMSRACTIQDHDHCNAVPALWSQCECPCHKEGK